ncbi:hypothetical protein Vqi01_02220 [Micromonospora qiuiae]|uniref:DUF695 domain-containing protein n=1 Tax=Micromonospora qiuiae TaxID=502268 RepID=A0ABQ4J4G4_9ACTN|nr:hypothetical protein Vqi01_02220 [Micromonospora qiuiae]
MGPRVSRVLDAICWDGTAPVVSLFVIPAVQEAPDFAMAWGDDVPRRTKTYCLEDDRPEPNLPPVCEYDFEFETMPVGLQQHLESCLRMACERAGSVAWFAFEGSFHFDHILTESVADQIYGICATGDSPLVVLDDEPDARAALSERMCTYRMRLGLAD